MAITILRRRRGQVIARPYATAKNLKEAKSILGVTRINEHYINTEAPVVSMNGFDYYIFPSEPNGVIR